MANAELIVYIITTTERIGIWLLWVYLIAIVAKRMIRKFREQYIDWMYVSIWIGIILTFVQDIIYNLYYWVWFFVWGENKKADNIYYIIFDYFYYAVFYVTWLLAALYPALLISYWNKLSHLNRGWDFAKVKKKINFVEFSSILIVFSIGMIYWIAYSINAIILYKNDWIGSQDKVDEPERQCRVPIWIKFSKHPFHLLFCLTLFVLNIVLFKNLKKIMQKRLHYFYQNMREKIQILYISGVIYYFFHAIRGLMNTLYEINKYSNNVFGDDLGAIFQILQLIWVVPVIISAIIYIYVTTKHLNFALYVRAWMIGYRVEDRFESMSFLITSSRFYNIQENSKDDLESSDTRYPSESSTQSMLEDIGGSKQNSTDNGSSTEC